MHHSDTEQAVARECAQIASYFTMRPGRRIHPDIAWEDMSEAARMAAHTTAQQIAEAIASAYGLRSY